MDKAAAHPTPAVGVLATDDDDISWHAQVAQGAMEAHRLFGLIGDLGLDDKEVNVAMRAASPRAWEPNRITCASGAAAAKRRPASAISVSSISVIVEIVVVTVDLVPARP